MTTKRHAEVVGGGFAGLASACALVQRGWSVRLHERDTALRTTGAGIYIYENGLRVLEALGAYEDAVRGAPLVTAREVRDERNELISVHHWRSGTRVYSIVRQQIINVLAGIAEKAGVEIVTGSEPVAATPAGEIAFSDGRRLKADLVICADGVNSKLRDFLGIGVRRKFLQDGAIRYLIDKTQEESVSNLECTTVEYWSGTRRVLYTPCSPTQIYVALTMLDRDKRAAVVPIQKAAWNSSFPYLAPLIDRLGPDGRYDRFELIKLDRWSMGRTAVVGDAAHALPPNIGQGGGTAMMNALSMAVYLDRHDDVAQALSNWEREERPVTEHAQWMSVLMGMPTTWPSPFRKIFYQFAARSKWMIRQRTKIVTHKPTGTKGTVETRVTES
ncbi:MAG TPA: NAD(P)/FAD-dependent oxidoreductase [Pseudolabrys sp.]|nr:NAD(P)/FAD-dependent oxidoreductase [Pseudolabrys sp.]